jgi:inner membrane protein
MDNLTHTLAGLALAETGLKRTSRLATVTLVLAANLPDLDGLSYLFGSGTDALGFRRGWTHGVLAMLVLPVVLSGAMLAWNRLVVHNRGTVRAGWLLALASIGVWSHPVLDLLNVYGVRLLMPFSSRWFYGDALFIMDPWIWGVLLLGILLAQRRGRAGTIEIRRVGRPAQAALAVSAVYALLMAGVSRWGERIVEQRASNGHASRTLAAPVFGNPLRRDIIRRLDGRYELGELTVGFPWRYRQLEQAPTGSRALGAAAAARTKQGATFLDWARFPRFETEPAGDSVVVTISDVRYEGGGGRSWASVTLLVPGTAAQRP